MAQLKMGDTTLISDSSGTPIIQSEVGFAAGHILQVVTNTDNTEYGVTTGTTPYEISTLSTTITLKQTNSKVLINFTFGAVVFQDTGNLGYGKVMFKIGSGSYSDVIPMGAAAVVGSLKHHMAVNYTDQTYQTDAGASMIVVHSTGISKDTEITYAPFFFGEGTSADLFINRSFRNSTADFASMSSCNLMEIAT